MIVGGEKKKHFVVCSFDFTQRPNVRLISMHLNWYHNAFFFLQDGGASLHVLAGNPICKFFIIYMHIFKCTRKSISRMDLHSFPPPRAEWAV